MMATMSKCHYFSHSRASRNQKVFLSPKHGGRQYLSVFNIFHFEIHFAGPVLAGNCRVNPIFMSVKLSRVFDYFNVLELLSRK